MKRTNLVANGYWLLAGMILMTTTGCGGCDGTTQADMMRAAMVSNGDDDDDDEDSAPAPATNNVVDPSDTTSASDANENQGEATAANTDADGSGNATNSGSGTSEQTQPTNDASAGNAVADSSGTGNNTTNNDAANEANNTTAETFSNWLPASTMVERRQRTIDNMTMISKVLLEQSESSRAMPVSAIFDPNAPTEPLLSWRVAILPYIGHQWLYDQFELDEPWDSERNYRLLDRIPDVFRQPDQPYNNSNTVYMLPIGTSTAFSGRRDAIRVPRIEDGLPKTIILVEASSAMAAPWTKPVDFQVNMVEPRTGLEGEYPDGFFVAFGSSQVRMILPSATNRNIAGMFTVDGGEAYSMGSISQRAEAEIASGPGASSGGNSNLASSGNTTSGNPTSDGATSDADQTSDNGGTGFSTNREAMVAQNLNSLALESLRIGESMRGFQQKYVALLVSEPADAARQYSWCEGLQRPVLSLRWGVGVDVVLNPRNTKGPEPITNDREDLERFRANLPGESGLEYYAGELGLRFLHMLRRRQEAGRFGAFGMLGDVESERTRRRSNSREFEPEQHYPGIETIGIGNRRVLTVVGNRAGLDVVVMYELDLRYVENGRRIFNSTKMHFIDVQTGESLFTSRSMNNIRVENQRADRLEEDPVPLFFDDIASFIDENLMLVALDDLRPEDARARIEALKADAPLEKPLQALCELHVFLGLGLISQYEYREASEIIAGDEEIGTLLLQGNAYEKREFLEKWIPFDEFD